MRVADGGLQGVYCFELLGVASSVGDEGNGVVLQVVAIAILREEREDLVVSQLFRREC